MNEVMNNIPCSWLHTPSLLWESPWQEGEDSAAHMRSSIPHWPATCCFSRMNGGVEPSPTSCVALHCQVCPLVAAATGCYNRAQCSQTHPVGNVRTRLTIQKGVFASLLHSYPTDDEPQHLACPHGEDYCCHYNR